jgi:hypothetical protein
MAAVPVRYWWLKRIAIFSVLFAVGLILLHFWWTKALDRLIQAKIAAIQAAGEPILPEDFDPTPVDENDNALAAYQKAYGLIVESATDTTKFGYFVGSAIAAAPSREVVREAIEAFRPSLELIRKARSMPSGSWGIRVREFDDIQLFMDRGTEMRRLALLLRVVAAYYHQNGDDASAIETLLDLMHLSSSMSEQPPSFTLLTGHLIDALASNVAASIAPTLAVSSDPGSGSKAADRAKVEKLIEELQDEESARNHLIHAFRFDAMLQQLEASPDAGEGVSSEMYQLQAIRYMPDLIDAAKKPSWPLAKSEMDSAYKNASKELISMPHPLLGIYHSLNVGTLQSYFKILERRRKAAVALAMRLFELDHGRRPTSLDELTPDILSRVPLDPFAKMERPVIDIPVTALETEGNE